MFAVNVVKQEPVSLLIQSIYVLIPFFVLIALYKIQKLRFGLLIGILLGLAFVAVDVPGEKDAFEEYYFNGDESFATLAIIQTIWIIGETVFWIWLIRRWSKEWNVKLSTTV